VDRNKVEEEGMRLLETVDKGQKEFAALQQHAAKHRARIRAERQATYDLRRASRDRVRQLAIQTDRRQH